MKFVYLAALTILLVACGSEAPSPEPTSPTGAQPTAAPATATAQPTAAPTEPGSPQGTATAQPGDPAGAPAILVALDASGGIAGIVERFEVWTDGKLVQTSDRAGSLAEGRATPDQLAELTALLASPDFKALKSEYAPPNACCDMMTYVLTIPGEGKDTTITTMDGVEQPEPLRKVIVLLNQLRLQTTQR